MSLDAFREKGLESSSFNGEGVEKGLWLGCAGFLCGEVL